MMVFPHNAIKSARHGILESYTFGILPVYGTVILKVAHYWTYKIMPIRFFMVDTKNEGIIPHTTLN